MAKMITRAQLDAAERYIASDRSDPFTRNRVMSHIVNGMAGNDYDAVIGSEHREYTKSRGEVVKYTVPMYTNIKRM